MKGVLFNVVEDVVTEVMSADAWDDIVERAEVSGAYTSLGNYPDEELGRLVAATAAQAELSEADTLRLSGRLGFKHLAERAPQLLVGLDDWRAVLGSLDDIIHPEVRKIYPESDVPGFDTIDDGDGLLVTYTSKRGLCALADGLMTGTGAWFDVTLVVVHESCIHEGDPACVMRVTEAG